MTPVVTSRGGCATWLLAVGMLLAITAPLLAMQPTAAGDPIGDLQAQAQAIAEKLNALQHQAELASERANGAEYQLSQLDVQISAARARADQANTVADLNAAVVSEWAVRAYVSQDGSDGAGQVFQGSGDAPATRLGYSRAVLGDRQQLVDDLHASQADAADAVRALQADEAAAKGAAEQAQAERARLVQLATQQQQVQSQVQGQLVQAVAQQQQAIEARAEQQAEAVARAAAPVTVTNAAQPNVPALAGATPPSEGRTPAPPVAPRPAPTTTAPRPAPKPPSPVPGPAPPAPPAPSGASTAVAAATSQVGKAYVWGGGSPTTGFDCSGLTSWAWARAGVSLPHFAQAQYDLTRRISASSLQPGDLVFYADATGYVYHVAMYIGGGQVVQALNEKYGVMIGSLYSAGSAPYGYGRV